MADTRCLGEPGIQSSRMTTEAEGFADLGLWQEAWEALEALPAEDRATPAALRVRLRCCPGVGAWDIGEHLKTKGVSSHTCSHTM